MLSSEAQQSLPQDAQVALQQVDNCKWGSTIDENITDGRSKILFNISTC